MWLDEATTWKHVQGSWSEGWWWVCNGDDCGGFAYYCLLKPVSGWLGTSEFALRLPSVVLGLGFVALMMHVGACLWGRRAALVLGVLAVLHPEAICWFRQARAYSLELFATAWCLAAVLMYARDGRWWRGLSLCAAGTLVATSHVFGIFVVGGVGLFLLVWQCPPTPRSAMQRLWPVVLPCLVTACWVIQMRRRVSANLNEFWTRGTYWEVLVTLWGWSFLVVAVGIALLIRDRQRGNNRLVLGFLACGAGVILGGPLLASFASRSSHNFIFPRYFLPLLPLSMVLMGYGLSRLPGALGMVAALVLGVGCVGLSHVDQIYGTEGYNYCDSRNAARFLTEGLTARDRVIVFPGHEVPSLTYYRIPSSVLRPLHNERKLEGLLRRARRASPHGHFWLVDYTDCYTLDQPTWLFGKLKVIQLQ
jgi:4-amino-4-deoxy-L-arabinose transferase-like glycosyltransferase